jgi:N-acetyl-anhydromuramyl-L-alanine amidase AmpD
VLGFPGNPNGWTISIETEDQGSPQQPVTGQQFEAVCSAVQMSLEAYPHIEFLCQHADISPKSRANCPGTRWTKTGMLSQVSEIFGIPIL